MVNLYIVSGNLVADPEMKYLVDGKAITKIRLANNDTKDKTEFFAVTVFDKTAEFCGEHLKKGVKVLVTGRMTHNEYTNNEGKQQRKMELVAKSVEFAANKKDTQEKTEN